MQNLQLHLTGAARSWLGKIEKETIGSWDELAKQFIGNFKSTYKMPASTEELKACTQKSGETLRSYTQRWSIIKIQPKMSPTREQLILHTRAPTGDDSQVQKINCSTFQIEKVVEPTRR
jgi:hypothetical protein